MFFRFLLVLLLKVTLVSNGTFKIFVTFRFFLFGCVSVEFGLRCQFFCSGSEWWHVEFGGLGEVFLAGGAFTSLLEWLDAGVAHGVAAGSGVSRPHLFVAARAFSEGLVEIVLART